MSRRRRDYFLDLFPEHVGAQISSPLIFILHSAVPVFTPATLLRTRRSSDAPPSPSAPSASVRLAPDYVTPPSNFASSFILTFCPPRLLGRETSPPATLPWPTRRLPPAPCRKPVLLPA